MAHASFLLASIFGLVTLLSIVQSVINSESSDLTWVSLVPFLFLSYIGYHTLRKFNSNAVTAQKLAWELHVFAPKSSIKQAKDSSVKAKKELIFVWVLERMREYRTDLPELALGLAYWLLVALTSYMVYWQSEDWFVRFFWRIEIAILPILIFVFLEPIRTLVLRVIRFFT